MTQEQLEIGKKIGDEIKNLNVHLGAVNLSSDTRYGERPITINRHRKDYRDEVHLYSEFLNMEEFTLIYTTRVKEKIRKLEEELAAL
jgi:hypothetical protein